MKVEKDIYQKPITLTGNKQGIVMFIPTGNVDTQDKANKELTSRIAKIIATHLIESDYFQENILKLN